MSRLRELAEQATPGPWETRHAAEVRLRSLRSARTEMYVAHSMEPGDAALIALAPDALVLLADAKDALAAMACEGWPKCELRPSPFENFRLCPRCALLARIEELEGKA